MNEWTLMGRGDILLMHTDGLTEHEGPNGRYFPAALEQKLREVKHLTAHQIYDAINEDLVAFADPIDDASVVVIKVK
jgi:serine phosphatase RsbU (regulator of sigma subunit)